MKKFWGLLIVAALLLLVVLSTIWFKAVLKLQDAAPAQSTTMEEAPIAADRVPRLDRLFEGRRAPSPTLSPSPTPLAVMTARGAVLEALPKGNIVLHAPDAMTVGEKRTVEANVGVNVPIEILRRQLTSRDHTIEGSLRVSSEMIAILNGPGFKIDAVTPEKQPIAEGFATVWSWNVEAKQDGEQELEATLYAIVGDDRQRVDSYVQKITVSVRAQTWGEWLQSIGHEVDAIKAILAALVGAATIALSWLGISLTRQKSKVAAKPRGRRKSPA
jgi:hypothetical protein